MGSSQALSNGNEPEELTALLDAFENLNRVELQLGMHLKTVGGKRHLQATMACWPVGLGSTVLTPSDYKSVRCWASEFKSLMGLVTSLLYKLDFELADSEWQKTKPKL